jgi:CheY-like chemotaxis protein
VTLWDDDEQTDAFPGRVQDGALSLPAPPTAAGAMTTSEFDLWPDSEVERSDLVVFESESGGEIADRLLQLDYTVRMAATGVDVMVLVAERPTAGVVVGPTSDGEQRRLLCAAIRTRFPGVPVVYVSAHADIADGVDGALREGAQAVLAWPLPNARAVVDLLDRVVGAEARGAGALATRPTRVSLASGPTPLAPGREAGDGEERPTPTAELPAAHVTLRPPSKRTVLADVPPTNTNALAGGPDTVKVEALREEDDELPMPTATGAAARPSADVVRAIRPFLWSLQDAARYLEESSGGRGPGFAHAQTLRALSALLDQLHDES